MQRLTERLGLSLIVLLSLAAATATAQSAADLSTAKPGRSPNQPIDEAYTKKILEYTTEKFFLSPLVDYLPASKSVPTPMAVLGDIAGAKNNLPYSKDVYAYMRLLAKSSPRVKVVSIGTTEEGREMIAVAVADEAILAKLESNREKLAKLADPRTINMDDRQAEAIVKDVTPVYYITGSIHSTESGAPTALMELAYRLAVDESPYIKHIRSKVITLITPIVEVDGRDRVVDLFKWHMAHPGETYPGLLYWGKYVAHDNNRDAMGVTLKLTQNVLNTYVDWKAQVLHDLHESGQYLYDNTIGDGPYNAWVDPLLTNEWQMMGWNNVQEMTRLGMPGVYAHGNFDTWSPGYLMFIAATHNGISRLYETLGNGGSAETIERTLSPDQTSRTWWRQNPPLPRVMWSLRNNNNYEQTGLLVSLFYFANNRHQLLQNFYEKSKRSVTRAKIEGPAAYVLTANDPRPGAQADLLKVLLKQRVEISRATAPFSVSLPVRRPAGGRGGAGAAGSDSAASTATETRQFPAGSYIIRMDQPYSRIADALLDHQYWSPNDPQKTPYDDTGWSFPENFNVMTTRVVDAKVLDTPMERVQSVDPRGGVNGTGTVFAINHNADNALVTLRYKLATVDMQAAEEPFEAAGQKFNRGSFIIRGIASGELDRVTKELGIKAYALGSAPTVKMHPTRAPRVALMHTWISTQTEGWWRQAFDFLQIPYDYISNQDLAKVANLNTKYDVIIFPPTGGSSEQIVNGLPMWRNAMPWKGSTETPNFGSYAQTDDIRPGMGLTGLANLQDFVSKGGVFITSENATDFAIQRGFGRGVSQNTPPRLHVVGSLLRTKVVDDASPIVYGIQDNLAVYSSEGESFNVSNTFGGRGGGRGGGGGRPTGRGLADDPDFVPGFPSLDPKNVAPAPVTVQPWQAAPISEDQLRNPLNIIPIEQRPRVALRFTEQRDLLASGLLDGTDVAQRPVVVDAPYDKGHVVLFANNPIYRGMTVGSYFLVFNAMLNFDNLNAGRKLDSR
ncbi:MAG: M14 family zinc carboxypeptidase [Gemmatimonadota bacterium]